jgi:hypothetical protein
LNWNVFHKNGRRRVRKIRLRQPTYPVAGPETGNQQPIERAAGRWEKGKEKRRPPAKNEAFFYKSTPGLTCLHAVYVVGKAFSSGPNLLNIHLTFLYIFFFDTIEASSKMLVEQCL